MIVEAAGWVQLCVSIGLVIDSFERLASARDYSDAGILAPRVMLDASFGISRATRAIRRTVCHGPTFRAVLIVRVALVAAALAPGLETQTRAGLLALVFAANLLVMARGLYGSDGSDQMDQVVVAGVVATYVLAPGGSAWIGLGFIAAQSLFSYAASGLAKLASPEWRQGRAVPLILATTAYGIPSVSRLLSRRPVIGTLASRGVIALECLFPLVLLLPEPGVFAMLALGASMHLGIAIVMGLNKFLFAWLATYPAIVACHDLLH